MTDENIRQDMAATNTEENGLLSLKSRERYEKMYKMFCEYRKKKNIKAISEDVMLEFFYEKAKIWKASSLWSVYSMLKSTLQWNENVSIQYPKLLSYLKRQNHTYVAKKSATLSMENIEKFLKEAPDTVYLLMKLVLIFGINGACRKGELCNLKIDDIHDSGLTLTVSIDCTKTMRKRRFTIPSESNGYKLYKKYANLRPTCATNGRFFLYYKDGRCTRQPVGINTFGKMPKRIAEFLNLPNANSYTGLCLRKTSAALFAYNEVNMSTAHRRRSNMWKRQVENSIENQTRNSEKIVEQAETIILSENDVEEDVKPSNNPEDQILLPLFVKCGESIPQDNLATPNTADSGLLPLKSRSRYEKIYQLFCDWKKRKNIKKISEDVMLTYFHEKAKIWKASSLWSVYSMLKSTLQLNENVNIVQYTKLLSFLKRQNHTYVARKSAILSMENIQQFLKEAPDEDYLLMKVVLIFGINGACRKGELCNLKIDDIHDTGLILTVTINCAITKKRRRFTVSSDNNGYDFYKRYVSLRPTHVPSRRFFVFYKKGKCTLQPVGINTLAKMPKRIAEFLNLPNANNYTGHCLRRTYATLLYDGEVDMNMLIRHKQPRKRRSYTVTDNERDVEDSTPNKIWISKKIFEQTEPIISSKNNVEKDVTPSTPLIIPANQILSDNTTFQQNMISDNGMDMNMLTRDGEWRSDLIAEEFVEDSIDSKIWISENIFAEPIIPSENDFEDVKPSISSIIIPTSQILLDNTTFQQNTVIV